MGFCHCICSGLGSWPRPCSPHFQSRGDEGAPEALPPKAADEAIPNNKRTEVQEEQSGWERD